jgi:bifunctional DNase/RNase
MENEHNHKAVNENTINRRIFIISCKIKALNDVSTRPKKIILQELIHNEYVKEITVKDINRIRKNMYAKPSQKIQNPLLKYTRL